MKRVSMDALRMANAHDSHPMCPKDQLAAVTFNLKDFRAMVSLCEQLGANILIRCEGPGMPVVLEPAQGASEEWGQDYAVELILATLVVEDDVDAQPPSQLAGEDASQLQTMNMEGELSHMEEHSGLGAGPHSQIARCECVKGVVHKMVSAFGP